MKVTFFRFSRRIVKSFVEGLFIFYVTSNKQTKAKQQTKLYFTFPYYITLKDICMASYIKVIEVLMVKLNDIDNNDGNT